MGQNVTSRMVQRIAACALGLLLAACNSGDRYPVADGPNPGDESVAGAGDVPARAESPPLNKSSAVPDGAGDSSARAVEEALDRALDEGWQQLHIRAECLTDAGADAVEILNGGVAIWNQEAQFELTREQLRLILQGFVSADFAHLQEQYGGDQRTGPPGLDPDNRTDAGPTGKREGPPRIICLLSLGLDGVSRQAVQLQGGEQSENLRQLAEHVLGICRQPAQSGVMAADLADGLNKVAAGELAPESLQVLLHRKPANEEGWLLQIRGLTASTRRFVPGKGYEDPLALALDPAEFGKLAQRLADLRFGELPGNLYADDYTDLKVSVLNRRSKVQAMQFAGMTPTQHGEQQERFDLVYGALRALHESVLQGGR